MPLITTNYNAPIDYDAELRYDGLWIAYGRTTTESRSNSVKATESRVAPISNLDKEVAIDRDSKQA